MDLYIIGYLVLFYIETLVITADHFFSYLLLVSKLCELTVFALCDIFQTCLVPLALFIFNPKTAEGGRQFDSPPVVFPKMYLVKRG